ncbi:hypothetical protein AUP07_0402 [methanogenic archaeon mixed culture ISO4-G1]|nr:hypothetical protein AUP07_0402 [methanogenic archaeon mixed culture ISO4-G1]
MTDIIDKDKVWLKESIERGINGFIDCEREYLTELLMKYIYEDIFLSGCSINSRDEATSEAILQIRIPLPDPDTCAELIDGMKPVSIFTEH